MAATDATKFLNKTEYENALARIKSYIDGVTPTKLSELTDDIVTGHYLPLAGGTLTGPLKWQNATALPATTSASYFLTVDAFSSGGQTKYITAANLASSIGLDDYLPLAGGTMTGRIRWVGTDVVGNKEGGWNISGNQNGIQTLDDTVTADTGSPGRYSSALHVGGYYAFQIANDRTNLLWRSSPGNATAWRTIYDDTNLTKSVLTTLLANTYAPYNANGYLPLSGGTLTGNLTISKDTSADLNIQTNTTGVAALTLTRGTQGDGYADWRMINDGGSLYFKRNVSGTWTDIFSANATDLKVGGNNVWHAGNLTPLRMYQYAVTGARNYYWVQINDTSSWSGSFTVKVYDGYHFEIYEISGYNYTNSTGWYNARARLLLSSSRSSVSVVFGYTAAQELWFVIPTVTTGSGQPHRLMICDYNGTNLQEDVDFSCTTVTSMDDVEGTVQSTVTCSAYLTTATGVTIGTDQTISGTKTFSSGELIISTATTGAPTLTFQRGTDSDAYVDHKIQSSGGAFGFVRSVSGTDTLQMELGTTALYPVGTVTSNISNMTLGNSTHYWGAVYAKDYYVGSESARVFSSATTNIALMNSNGSVLVVDGKVVRRGTASSLADTTLGDTTYPWANVYASEMTIIGGTSGSPTLNLVRGTESDTYVDWKVSNDNGTFRIIRSASGTDTNYVCVSSLALFPSGTLTSGVSDIDLGGSSNRWGTLYTSAINASGLSTLAGGIVLGTSTNAVAAKMEWDETNNAWKLNGNFYATGFVSAGGISTSGSSGGGSDVNVIRNWSEYVATDVSQALGANLGYSLKSSIDGHDQDIYELDNRVTALEQGGGGGGGGTTTDPTLRMYPTTTNAWYPVLTRYNTTSGSTYYTEYGRYAADVTINPSNGSLSATNISALNSIDTQGSLDIGLDASIGGDLTVTGGIQCDGLQSDSLAHFMSGVQVDGTLQLDGQIQLMSGTSASEYQYPRYKLCASEAAYNAITTKQSDVLYLIPE